MPAWTRLVSVMMSRSVRKMPPAAARKTSEITAGRRLCWTNHCPKQAAERIRQTKNSGQVALPISQGPPRESLGAGQSVDNGARGEKGQIFFRMGGDRRNPTDGPAARGTCPKRQFARQAFPA